MTIFEQLRLALQGQKTRICAVGYLVLQILKSSGALAHVDPAIVSVAEAMLFSAGAVALHAAVQRNGADVPPKESA